MNMKVITIMYQQKDNPMKISLVGGVFKDLTEAYKHCAVSVTNDNPDTVWIPVVSNTVEIDTKQIPSPVKKVDEFNENWLMSRIISNKDIELFNTSKKYLSEVENLYIEEKLNENRII